MAIAAESLADPIRVQHPDIQKHPATPATRSGDAIRTLATVITEQSGSPGWALAVEMADVATALWTRFHKFDAADPRWPDRDRFVLSAGHGSSLLYALIHLTGHHGMSIDDIRNVRRLHSPAAVHPEYAAHPAIETTSGPLGQGLATAVGMAIAERNMAARFGKSLVDHRTWVIASEADMMQGISHEAVTLAGQFGLSKLTVLYGEPDIASDTGSRRTDIDAARPGSDDVLKRFSACGWATKRVDGYDPAQISAALSSAIRSKKPTMIACRTEIAGDAPNKPATNGVHAFPAAPALSNADIPDDIQQRWHIAGSRGASARRSWLKRLARHNQRAEFERVMAGRLPDNWHEAVAELKQHIASARPKFASSLSSQKCLDVLIPAIPELLGGSASLTGTAPAGSISGAASISVGNYGVRHIQFGSRDHGMGAVATGMALHGGIIPHIGTSFVFTDYLRPALRLCAMMRQRVVYVLTDDSIGLGEDGPTHQPVEHLASLRAMPNLFVFRPADAMETAESWELALRRADGPSLLVLSRQTLLPWRTDMVENRSARGGYVLAEAEGPRQATIIATGSEVAIAMAAREKLAGDSIAVAVVSLPCWELFRAQDDAYRAQVLGGAPRVGIEAAAGFGWEQWLGSEGIFIGMTGFGASASHQELYTHFGITADAVVAAVNRRLA